MVNEVIRIKDCHGQKGPFYVLFVLKKVMVNKVIYISICIKDSHGQ
jgi:hypothetical protein